MNLTKKSQFVFLTLIILLLSVGTTTLSGQSKCDVPLPANWATIEWMDDVGTYQDFINSDVCGGTCGISEQEWLNNVCRLYNERLIIRSLQAENEQLRNQPPRVVERVVQIPAPAVSAGSVTVIDSSKVMVDARDTITVNVTVQMPDPKPDTIVETTVVLPKAKLWNFGLGGSFVEGEYSARLFDAPCCPGAKTGFNDEDDKFGLTASLRKVVDTSKIISIVGDVSGTLNSLEFDNALENSRFFGEINISPVAHLQLWSRDVSYPEVHDTLLASKVSVDSFLMANQPKNALSFGIYAGPEAHFSYFAPADMAIAGLRIKAGAYVDASFGRIALESSINGASWGWIGGDDTIDSHSWRVGVTYTYKHKYSIGLERSVEYGNLGINSEGLINGGAFARQSTLRVGIFF